jgi:hypothetical protein
MTSRPTDEVAAPTPAGGRRWLAARLPAELGWDALELFVLAGFAVAQPLLDVTGKAPDFFLFNRVTRGDILVLLAAIVLLPPLALWLVELAARLAGDRARRLVHLALVTGLFAVLALEVGKKLTPLRGKKLALAALLAGLAAGWAYARWPVVKLWLRYLAPAPLVFALLFATTSPVSKLILPQRADAATAAPRLARPGEALPPVVIVFFDEFPLQSLLDSHGQVDQRVYPNFAALARQSTWYRNGTGVSGYTPWAVPAMLTSHYPDKRRKLAAPVTALYPDNLFTMFGHYYNLDVSETVTQLCPPARCGQTEGGSGLGTVVADTAKLYGQIASPLDAPVDPATIGENPAVAGTTGSPDVRQGANAFFHNLGADQSARVDAFVRSIHAGDRQPTLYFLHVLMPHAPWRRLPDGRTYGDPVGRPVTKKGLWPDALTKLNHQRHLLQLAYTDTLLGRIVDRLKQQGLYDKALMVVTADHGSGFSPLAQSRALGGGDAPTLLWVPVFIKRPGQTVGRVDDRNWEQVDLLPTVADLVGLGVPWKVDGYDQTGPPRRARTDKWWYESGVRKVAPGPPNFAQMLRGVTDTLVRAHQDGPKGFFEFAMDPRTAGWVYRTPQQVGRVVAGSAGSARMADWKRFDTVTPGAAHVPDLIAGVLSGGPPPPGAVMVLTVNGRIGGTAGFYPPHEHERPTAFAAMVPDFLYHQGPGKPQIKAYLAIRSGTSVTLRQVRLSG